MEVVTIHFRTKESDCHSEDEMIVRRDEIVRVYSRVEVCLLSYTLIKRERAGRTSAYSMKIHSSCMEYMTHDAWSSRLVIGSMLGVLGIEPHHHGLDAWYMVAHQHFQVNIL